MKRYQELTNLPGDTPYFLFKYQLDFILTASNMEFSYFSIWYMYNVKCYTVLTPKMIWEPLNCG